MRLKHKLIVTLLAMLVISSPLLGIIASPKASAAACTSSQQSSTTYELNGTKIIETNQSYSTLNVRGDSICSHTTSTETFSKTSGKTYTYTNSTSHCTSTITLAGSGAGAATLKQQQTIGGGHGGFAQCGSSSTYSTSSITVSDNQPDHSCTDSTKTTYAFSGSDITQTTVNTSASTCVSSTSTKTFTGDSSATTFTWSNAGARSQGCAVLQSTITLASAGASSGTYKDSTGSGCNDHKQTVQISGTAPQPDNGSGTSTDLSCDSQVPVLGWLLCKLIDGIQNAVGGIYDHIINPLLTLEPITHKTSSGAVNPIYTAWSNFRIYGDVFLFIAILVIVFGESIGGGILDAYSVKKIMPRLLIAALLINISFYLVAIAVDIANIVGTGLSDLITAPFRMGGNFDLQVGTTGSVGLTTLLLGAIVWAKITLSGQFLAWLWFSVLLPLLLIFLAIMVTVLLRQALVIFLVIISPVAFALYCLPNTEKYFKKWWDMLFETLLVFPIIASLFAMGKVSAYLLSNSTNQSFLANGISNIMAVIALVIPLLLIPFSFKIAGGLIGRAHELATGARTKMNLGGATRERIKAQGARNRLQARGSAYAALQKQGSKGGAFRRNTLGRLAKGSSGLLGYNVEAEMSAARAEVGKTLNDQIATGKDDEIRGLTVNKAWAEAQGPLRRDAEGNMTNDYMRTTASGMRQYKSLGGQWVNEADVDRGHARWGKDTFAQQTALSYEMRKAMDEGQLQTLAKNYRSVAQGIDANGNKVGGGWGMTDEQAGGAWIGAAFERQNEHLEFKSTDWKTGQLSQDSKTAVKDSKGNNVKGTGLSGVGLVDEVYEKKGSYPVSQMGSNTIEQLKESWQSAERVLSGVDADGNAVTYTNDQRLAALDHQGKLQAIAETFMHEAGGAEGIVIGQTANGEDVVGNGSGKRQSGAQGAAHVAERVREFAVLTGSYEQAPSGQYIKRDHAPTPNGREQK